MRSLILAVALSVVGASAFAAEATCSLQAGDKKLAGAAKTSFMKKCEADAGAASSCATKAVSKDGKPLAGAAKASFIKKCEADAKP